jgi:tetratricopeptide (TPR) repeat protein
MTSHMSRWSIVNGHWSERYRLWTIDHGLFLLLLLISTSVFGQRPDPVKLKQWEAQGDTLMGQQQYAEATKVFTKIIDGTKLSEKSDYNALYKRAICQYYTEGQHDLALADVDKFIQEFPYVPQSHILRALIYRIKEDVDKQLEDLNTALELQPANPGLFKWRAGLLLDKEEYEKARSDAKMAILFQDDPEAEAYLAFAHFNLNNPDSALLAINKAIELDYSYVPAYLYGGSFCLQSSEYELALKYLNLGMRVDPENAALLFYKGVALVELEKIDQACSCLNKAFYMGYDDASGYIEEYCYKVEDP